jgi:hypothetical protein
VYQALLILLLRPLSHISLCGCYGDVPASSLELSKGSLEPSAAAAQYFFIYNLMR